MAALDDSVVVLIVYQHWMFNPHARCTLHYWSGTWSSGAPKPLVKWTPGLPIPIHWYSFERFSHRILLEIRKDPRITVAQFMSGFRGLSSSTVRSQVAAAAGLACQALLQGTALDAHRTHLLLAYMREVSRSPKNAVLGAIGKDGFAIWVLHQVSRIGSLERPPFFVYYSVKADGIPYRWEVGFCHLPGADKRQVLVGMNFSPAIEPARLIDDVMDEVGWQFAADQPIDDQSGGRRGPRRLLRVRQL